MRIGIIGAGWIAGVMADTINRMQDSVLYAISARNMERAQKFADKYGAEKAYGSYEDMLCDDNVELVYIATPHSHHYEHMKMCIEHHKPVLCEKAFTMNATQAREIKKLAQDKNVYVAEAIWTRYMPSRKMIDEALASGIIGKPCIVTCNLAYDIDGKERIMSPCLAGGALLDVGVYGLNFITMHLGKDIERIESSVMMTDTGIDGQECITLMFKNKIMAVTTHSIFGRSDRKGIIYGEKGYIVVENINNPQEINIYDTSDKLIKHMDVPLQISGYEYEVMEAEECIRKGRIESSSMPLDESIYMMDMMDCLREKWGLVYPQEKEQQLKGEDNRQL